MEMPDSRFFSSHLRNNKGSLLVWLAIILIIVTAAISASVYIIGSKAVSGKIASTIGSLDTAVKAVISYGTTNKVLPNNTIFPTLLSSSKDPWGNDFIYLYDGNMTSTATGGLCGLTTTSIQDNGVQIAFLILSKGPDSTLDSTVSGTSGPVSYPNLSAILKNTDIYKVVSLEELKNKAGCYGSTGGRLAILNNSLPDACTGSSTYTANVYAAGGVPNVTGGYSFSLINSPPSWITINTTTGLLSPNTSITGTADVYPVTVQVSDSQSTPNTVTKTFNLKAKSCSTVAEKKAPLDITSLATPAGTGVSIASTTITLGSDTVSGTTAGCTWSTDSQPFGGSSGAKTMRAYYNFKFSTSDTSVDSALYGDGFTYALMTGSNATTVCGDPGPNLGYAGTAIGANSLAVEFDTRSDSSAKSDPLNNQIAAVGGASNSHSGSNATCSLGSAPLAIPSEGCYYNDNATWFEDALTHKARVEIRNGYDSTCTTFTPNSTSNRYALLRAWVDCNDCSDLTSDYTQTPLIKRCFSLTSSMDNVKFGFTHAAEVSKATISNLGAGFYTQTTGDVKTWVATNPIKVESVTQTREYHTSLAYNGYLYVIGGYNGTIKDTVYYASINADGTIGTWKGTTSFDIDGAGGATYPRYAHTSVINNGYLYVIGGSDGATKNTVYYAPINTDGTIGRWNETTSIKDNVSTIQPRWLHTSVINNGYLYVIGGYNNGSIKDTVYYAPINADGTIGLWSETTSIKDNASTSQPRYSHTSVVNNGYLYVVGGFDGSDTTRDKVYKAPINSDGATGLWSETTSIKDNASTSQPRGYHTSVVNNGYLYVIGGETTGGVLKDTVYYVPFSVPAPTLTLTANPTSVAPGGGTTTLSYAITNGPVKGTWSPSPGGTCADSAYMTSGSCTTGTITPPQTFTLNVSNGGGSDSKNVTVNVPQLSFITTSLAQSVYYSYVGNSNTTINVSTTSGPYNWSISGFPSGMSLSNAQTSGPSNTLTGYVSWPQQARTFAGTITVTDAYGSSKSQIYSASVQNGMIVVWFNLANNGSISTPCCGCWGNTSKNYQLSVNYNDSGNYSVYEVNNCSGSPAFTIGWPGVYAADANNDGTVTLDETSGLIDR